MQLSDSSIKDILIKENYIAKDDLEKAENFVKNTHETLVEYLLSQGYITKELLTQAIADFYHVPFIFLPKISINQEILKIIPETVARKQKIIAFKRDNMGLHIATANPTNTEIIELLKRKVGDKINTYFSLEQDIDQALSLYATDVVKAFDEIISENIQTAKYSSNIEPPIIKIVDTILKYAYQNKASDIHIEPLKDYSLIRFRIDGVLHDIVHLPLRLHTSIITRIKVLSDLRTDEHQAAQDGKFKFKSDSEDLDIRVSIVPSTNGEKIVMRLLSSSVRKYSFADLGFMESDHKKIRSAYEKPYGMILATGPTGSGKTTTMYVILEILNRRDVNIMTIEDPVEYDIESVTQIQVNPQTNLTFADGLKSILRQDPNIILVGEIRDNETADIAVNAAMTGHLVLSTLHTNDAVTAIPRLFDMKVEPFLVASTVNIVIAQRLIRKIHTVCRVSEEIEVESLSQFIGKPLLKETFGAQKRIRLYKGKGCNLCRNTGYEGRMGIFEVLSMDDDLRQAISDRKDSSMLRNIAIKNGMTTMMEDGLEKVKEGFTTIEEILRVTKE